MLNYSLSSSILFSGFHNCYIRDDIDIRPLLPSRWVCRPLNTIIRGRELSFVKRFSYIFRVLSLRVFFNFSLHDFPFHSQLSFHFICSIHNFFQYWSGFNFQADPASTNDSSILEFHVKGQDFGLCAKV